MIKEVREGEEIIQSINSLELSRRRSFRVLKQSKQKKSGASFLQFFQRKAESSQ